MIARATGVLTAKTLLKTLILEMCIFTIIRTINVPTANSTKFLLLVDILMSSLALFFLTSLAIFGKIERFSSRLNRFPTKKFQIFASQTEAHPGFGKGGGTTEVIRVWLILLWPAPEPWPSWMIWIKSMNTYRLGAVSTFFNLVGKSIASTPQVHSPIFYHPTKENDFFPVSVLFLGMK